MGKRQTKIDQMGLGALVVECIGQGMTSYAIAAKISAEITPIDQSTVSRWIAANRGEAQSKASKMFAEHIDRELPKDLDALEEMERICLDWAREDIASRSERITSWDRVTEALDNIASRLIEASHEQDPRRRNGILKAFLKQVAGWVQDDYADQKRRLDAMAMGAKIIVGKLQHAGVLATNEDFGIVIKPYDDSKPLGTSDPAGNKNRLFTVKTARVESA